MQKIKNLNTTKNITKNLNISTLKNTITIPNNKYNIIQIHTNNPNTLKFQIYTNKSI